MPENRQYDRVREITDQLEAGIADLFNSDQYRQWLTTMSRFHDYSLNNTILIAMQKPDATLVAGYTSWQKTFGRQVNRGEKAIRILAPTPYKQRVEVDKTDPNTGEILKNPDGTSQKEIQEILRPAFKVVNVFDVSQTTGRELPTLGINELNGDVEQFDIFFEALKRTCPVPVNFEQIESGAKGYYHQIEQRIAIQEGMSQVQTVKTAIHEMAHQKLHAIDSDTKKAGSEPEKLSRNGKEVEAESVAYTVCQHFGIDTSDYSFAYIAGWSHGKETPELKASLNTIRKAASEMISEITENMLEITKEREETLEAAAFEVGDHCLEIHRAQDGGWDFTLFGNNYRIVDEGSFDDPIGVTMDYAVSKIVDFYQLSQHQPVEMDRDLLAELHSIYVQEPIKSNEQMAFIAEVMKQGYDPREYWVAGKAIDLTARQLSSEQLADIQYQTKVDAIPKMLFTTEQWHEIEAGIAEQIDVTKYADPALSVEEMRQIHSGLNAEQAPSAESQIPDAKKIPDARQSSNDEQILQPAEPQTYRYYSTQRPVAPGIFPKPQDNAPVKIKNFDSRQPVENGQLQAWGYLEYPKPLTEQQMHSYELKPVPNAARQEVSTDQRRAKARARQSEKRKSVLADLHEKQAQVAGADAPKPAARTKGKEME